jgi:hypothetical protein
MTMSKSSRDVRTQRSNYSYAVDHVDNSNERTLVRRITRSDDNDG